MQMRQQPDSDTVGDLEGACDQCGDMLYRYRGGGDISCDCGAIYNSFGQRLRDDLHSRPNPSEHDYDIDDMTGYEIAIGHDG